MAYDKPVIQTSNPNKKADGFSFETRGIYYGEVISIDDPTDGGRIKVRIERLDNGILNENLNWSYPMLPKFFHIIPQVGELVRIFLEDSRYPQRGRFWLGSVISQPQKIGLDTVYWAQSTTNMALTPPLPAPSTIADAQGVFPEIDDIAIVGKVNTDVILRLNEVHIRAGKHENDDILKLNTKNPAQVSLVYEQNIETGTYYSSSMMQGDKIALISHTGNPQFKAARLDAADRERIFTEGHPLGRGDVIVEAFKVIRNALINHIHGYAALPADKNSIIKDLESLNFETILQENIVIN